MVRNGKLKLDKYQRHVVEQLQRLYGDVVNYQPASDGFLSKVRILTNGVTSLPGKQFIEIVN